MKGKVRNIRLDGYNYTGIIYHTDLSEAQEAALSVYQGEYEVEGEYDVSFKDGIASVYVRNCHVLGGTINNLEKPEARLSVSLTDEEVDYEELADDIEAEGDMLSWMEDADEEYYIRH